MVSSVATAGPTAPLWHADDAVANLIRNLENIAATHPGRELALPIVLDGENAWEFYPENGHYFLDALYKSLAGHERINLTKKKIQRIDHQLEQRCRDVEPVGVHRTGRHPDR